MAENEERNGDSLPVFQLTDGLVHELELGIDALEEKYNREKEEGIMSLGQWAIEQDKLATAKRFLQSLREAGEAQTGEEFPANRG